MSKVSKLACATDKDSSEFEKDHVDIMRRSSTMMGIAIYFLSRSLRIKSLTSHSMSHLWALGFGRLSLETLTAIRLPSGRIMVAIFVANAPQSLLSCFYLTVNSLLTSMLLADEWSKLACERKTLRVTSPKGKQRSTYRLTLPYSYGVSSLVILGVLHWLVSQALFLARLDVYDGNILDQMKSISSCGFSPIAIIFSLIAIGLILISVLGTSLRKYGADLPYVGSCSAAISAACHQPGVSRDASKKPVKWGAVSHGSGKRYGQEVGHCTITDHEVETPVNGRLYK